MYESSDTGRRGGHVTRGKDSSDSLTTPNATNDDIPATVQNGARRKQTRPTSPLPANALPPVPVVPRGHGSSFWIDGPLCRKQEVGRPTGSGHRPPASARMLATRSANIGQGLSDSAKLRRKRAIPKLPRRPPPRVVDRVADAAAVADDAAVVDDDAIAPGDERATSPGSLDSTVGDDRPQTFRLSDVPSPDPFPSSCPASPFSPSLGSLPSTQANWSPSPSPSVRPSGHSKKPVTSFHAARAVFERAEQPVRRASSGPCGTGSDSGKRASESSSESRAREASDMLEQSRLPNDSATRELTANEVLSAHRIGRVSSHSLLHVADRSFAEATSRSHSRKMGTNAFSEGSCSDLLSFSYVSGFDDGVCSPDSALSTAPRVDSPGSVGSPPHTYRRRCLYTPQTEFEPTARTGPRPAPDTPFRSSPDTPATPSERRVSPSDSPVESQVAGGQARTTHTHITREMRHAPTSSSPPKRAKLSPSSSSPSHSPSQSCSPLASPSTPPALPSRDKCAKIRPYSIGSSHIPRPRPPPRPPGDKDRPSCSLSGSSSLSSSRSSSSVSVSASASSSSSSSPPLPPPRPPNFRGVPLCKSTSGQRQQAERLPPPPPPPPPNGFNYEVNHNMDDEPDGSPAPPSFHCSTLGRQHFPSTLRRHQFNEVRQQKRLEDLEHSRVASKLDRSTNVSQVSILEKRDRDVESGGRADGKVLTRQSRRRKLLAPGTNEAPTGSKPTSKLKAMSQQVGKRGKERVTQVVEKLRKGVSKGARGVEKDAHHTKQRQQFKPTRHHHSDASFEGVAVDMYAEPVSVDVGVSESFSSSRPDAGESFRESRESHVSVPDDSMIEHSQVECVVVDVDNLQASEHVEQAAAVSPRWSRSDQERASLDSMTSSISYAVRPLSPRVRAEAVPCYIPAQQRQQHSPSSEGRDNVPKPLSPLGQLASQRHLDLHSDVPPVSSNARMPDDGGSRRDDDGHGKENYGDEANQRPERAERAGSPRHGAATTKQADTRADARAKKAAVARAKSRAAKAKKELELEERMRQMQEYFANKRTQAA